MSAPSPSTSPPTPVSPPAPTAPLPQPPIPSNTFHKSPPFNQHPQHITPSPPSPLTSPSPSTNPPSPAPRPNNPPHTLKRPAAALTPSSNVSHDNAESDNDNDNDNSNENTQAHASNAKAVTAADDNSTPNESAHSSSTRHRRRRKKPRTFDFDKTTPSPAARRPSTGSLGLTGAGVKLSAIPNVSYRLSKIHAREPVLEIMHRLLFNTAGMAVKRKMNIRSFSGFVFSGKGEGDRAREKLTRAHLNIVRRIATILDITVMLPAQLSGSVRGEGVGGGNGSKGRASDDRRPSSCSVPSSNASTTTNIDSPSPPNESAASGLVNAPSREDGNANANAVAQAAVAKVVDAVRGRCEDGGDDGDGDGDGGGDGDGDGEGDGDGNGDGKARKTDAQRREEQRMVKEVYVDAIFAFLQRPYVVVGRPNLANREKTLRAKRRAAERAARERKMQSEGGDGGPGPEGNVQSKGKGAGKLEKSTREDGKEKEGARNGSGKVKDSKRKANVANVDVEENAREALAAQSDSDDGSEDLEEEGRTWIELSRETVVSESYDADSSGIAASGVVS